MRESPVGGRAGGGPEAEVLWDPTDRPATLLRGSPDGCVMQTGCSLCTRSLAAASREVGSPNPTRCRVVCVGDGPERLPSPSRQAGPASLQAPRLLHLQENPHAGECVDAVCGTATLHTHGGPRAWTSGPIQTQGAVVTPRPHCGAWSTPSGQGVLISLTSGVLGTTLGQGQCTRLPGVWHGPRPTPLSHGASGARAWL